MCGIGFYKSSIPLSSQKTEQIKKAFYTTQGRGPDRTIFEVADDKAIVGFHRLAIMDPSAKGDQPFITPQADGNVYVVCNGEIYNYKEIIKKYDLHPASGSDCEVIPLLYQHYGIETVTQELLGEFAFIIYDQEQQKVFAGRDPIGVRPLFWGTQKEDKADFGLCSELKGLAGLYDEVIPFPPGKYMSYDLSTDLLERTTYYAYEYYTVPQEQSAIEENIRTIFEKTVQRRLMSDRPLGCLLSGGLDSSICSAIAAKYSPTKIKTFTIGLEGATDIPYAEKVAEHIGSDHKTIYVSIEEALQQVEETIFAIESFDITTVRASVWQFLLAKKIKEQTDIKVLLCGELSDELMSGYKYFHKAPDATTMHEENIRLVRDVYLYDGLRTDRTMSCNGLEVRLPFADVEFVDYFLTIEPELRMPKDGAEKYLFRKAFDATDLLPKEVLRRSKEALSDGTSGKQRSWFEILQEYIDTIVSDEEFLTQKDSYTHCPPRTKEAYYYRKKFVEYFGDKYSNVIPYFWLPKRCGDVIDPSARVLKDVYK